MTIADQVTGSTIAGPADAKSAGTRPRAAAPAITLPAIGERELRLDLFRGLALWLIFIDHLPSSLLTWFTIRNYGFSDATEIFIFISGYTAAFVYGRAMLESGVVIATARILRRVWQIYVAHVFLFTIFLAEISYVATSFENPLYTEEMGIMDFLKQPDVTIVQALLLRFRPVNMDVLPLYIVLMLALPLILWSMKWKPDVTLGLSVVLYAVTWEYDLYFSAYPNGFWAFNPLAWQLLFVFGAWCALGGARRMSRILASPVTMWISIAYLVAAFYVTLTWYVPQLSHLMPEAARAVDVSDRQDRPRRAALHPFPGTGRAHRALPAAGLAGPEIALAAAADPVRPAFPGDLLPRRLPGLRRPFRPGRGIRRPGHAWAD
ncbi:hypothetical protein ACVWXO_001956 [Bradyrhizobium sp. LM2.7]